MKKIVLTLVAAFAAISMDAQVYVGGSIGFTSVKNGDSQTEFKFVPEIGYNFNDQWAAGIKVGYQDGYADMDYDFQQYKGLKILTINPYARYTFLKSNLVSLFIDGGLEYSKIDGNDDAELGIGLTPGLALNLSDKLSFVTHVGFIGYKSYGDVNKFGLDLDGNNLTFGLYYNF